MKASNRIVFGDNLPQLQRLPSESVDLVFFDPPFGRGYSQKRTFVRTHRDDDAGDRTGFQGQRYRTEKVSESSYDDGLTGDEYLDWLRPRCAELMRVLKKTGTLYCLLDWHSVHHAKVMLDALYGREKYLGSLVHHWDYGAKTKRRWPQKHSEILHYCKTEHYYHDADAADRVPYLAPELVGPEKAAQGKRLTNVWFITIPAGHERVGYATQKPLKLLDRIVRVSCPEGGLVLDPFAGSGTTGAAALLAKRRFILMDSHDEALRVMAKRFAGCADVSFENVPERLLEEVLTPGTL